MAEAAGQLSWGHGGRDRCNAIWRDVGGCRRGDALGSDADPANLFLDMFAAV
jgi:hypothetical protein